MRVFFLIKCLAPNFLVKLSRRHCIIGLQKNSHVVFLRPPSRLRPLLRPLLRHLSPPARPPRSAPPAPSSRHVLEAGRRVAAREFTRTSAGPRCRRCSVVGGRRSRVRRYFGRRDCADGRVPLFRMRPSLCKPIHHALSMEAGDFSENLRGGVDSSFAVV